MNPVIPIIGLLIFLLCFFIHIIWWRWECPRRDVFALFIIFFIIPVILIFCYYILYRIKTPQSTFINLISILLFHTPLSSAYIMSYPVIQAGCPTLDILLVVNKLMPNGVTKERIRQLLGEDALLDIIVKKMIEGGLAREMDGIIIPTRIGRIIATIFIVFRSFLGISGGKG